MTVSLLHLRLRMERTNISYYTVPAAWFLCLAPHVYAITLYDKASTAEKFDRVNPRTLLSAPKANRMIDSSTKQRIARAEGAQLNGFENLGFFAGSVVAANAAGVNVRWLNALSMIYLFSRALYAVLYIKGVSRIPRGGPFHAALMSVSVAHPETGADNLALPSLFISRPAML